ncbi:MAG: type 4a pilus biogenesis protein PilO [Candidatus Omnitrophica bacterium]|nr:type 4a pilus biogenesis protein PilO [Candidatus Omnitrophota bacterium]
MSPRPAISLKTKRQQVLAGVFLVVAVGAWVYYAYALTPLMRTVGRLAKDVSAASKQLKAIETSVAQEPQLRQEHARLTQAIDALQTAVPREEDLPAVIQRLSEVAHQTGVKIQTIHPQRSLESVSDDDLAFLPPAPKPPAGKAKTKPAAAPGLLPYRGIPIQIDAQAGFHQAGAFVSQMEGGDQAMRLTQVRISANSKDLRRHQVRITMLGYFMTPPEADAPRTGAPGS